MERATPYLKAATVVSAIVLGGAFVAYRAGAFARPAPVEMQPEQLPSTVPFAPAESAPPADPSHIAIMLGSKSAPTFTPSTPGTPEPNNTIAPSPGSRPPPALLGGSKSIQLLPAPVPPGTAPPAGAPKP